MAKRLSEKQKDEIVESFKCGMDIDALSQKNISSQTDPETNVLSYPLKEAREKFEKDYLASQLKKHKGNIEIMIPKSINKWLSLNLVFIFWNIMFDYFI